MFWQPISKKYRIVHSRTYCLAWFLGLKCLATWLFHQTLQTLSGIFLKYCIETLLAYFSWRNLKSKIEIKSSAIKLLFLATGLEMKCSIHPQILTFNHKNSCSATKLPTSLFFCSVGTFLLHFTLWPYVSELPEN